AQDVAAPLPLLAVQQAGALQLEKDGFEEFLRETLPLRQFGDEYRALVRLLGEHEQRFQAVFRLAGEHWHHSIASVIDFLSGVRRKFGVRDRKLLPVRVRLRLLLSEGHQGPRAFGHAVGARIGQAPDNAKRSKPGDDKSPGFFILDMGCRRLRCQWTWTSR